MSTASSRCRIELPADRLGPAMLVGGGLLGAVGVAASSLAWPWALAAWCVCALLAAGEWRRRRRRPRALALLAPDHVELEAGETGPGGPEPTTARLVDWRRLGPVLILQLAAADPDGRRRRIELWLPSLPLNDRHALLRQLPRMRPQPGPTV